MTIPTITVIPNFLPTDVYQEILDFAISSEDKFQPSVTTDNRPDLRKSSIIYDFPFDQWLKKPLNDILLTVLSGLQLLPFPIDRTESQLTATGNGGFYAIHTDNGSAACAKRLLSYIYYCHANPKPFEGGELKVYGHEETTYEPIHNQLVCFSSSHNHEVLPVKNSGKWEDSRFTINGWFTMGSFDTIPTLPVDELTEAEEMPANYGAIG